MCKLREFPMKLLIEIILAIVTTWTVPMMPESPLLAGDLILTA